MDRQIEKDISLDIKQISFQTNVFTHERNPFFYSESFGE